MKSNQLRQKIRKLRQKLEFSQDAFVRKVNMLYITIIKIEADVI